MSTLSIIKTQLGRDIYSVDYVFGIAASSFCQPITEVREDNKRKARTFTCINKANYDRLRGMFCDNPVPGVDDSQYDFYALQPDLNHDRQEDGEWTGVSILLKTLKGVAIDSDRVMLKIQRERSQECVETISIYAYNHEATDRDVMREVKFFQADEEFYFDRIPFLAIKWNAIKNGSAVHNAIVLDKPQGIVREPWEIDETTFPLHPSNRKPRGERVKGGSR